MPLQKQWAVREGSPLPDEQDRAGRARIAAGSLQGTGSSGQGRRGVWEEAGVLTVRGHLIGTTLSSAELFETVRLPKCKSDQLLLQY